MKQIYIAFTAFLILSLSLSAQDTSVEKGGASNLPTKIIASGKKKNRMFEKESGIVYYPYSSLMRYADAAKLYARSYHLNSRYAFLVNMGMRSSVNRFFVVDLKKRCVLKSSLVAHGRGDSSFSINHNYSNIPGSNNTSLGKYKTGKSYTGFFGLTYKLHGLDATNSRALDRKVVLHSMHCIPNEANGYPICQSEGCPSVSDQFMLYLKDIIDGSDRPVLIWIFDSTYFTSKKVSLSAGKKKKRNSKEKQKTGKKI